MKRKHFFSAITVMSVFLIAVMISFAGCAGRAETQTSDQTQEGETVEITNPVQTEPKVFFTTDISPAGLMAVYNALGQQPSGRVAVKISTGEPPNSNYLRPELIKDLVQSVNGTLVESNTAYGGRRASTAVHKQVAADHGFTAIANVDILDENGSISLPVRGGTRLQENFVGAHFTNYDYYIVLSHFKGHQMAGLGGAMKKGIAQRRRGTEEEFYHEQTRTNTNRGQLLFLFPSQIN